MDNKHKLNLPYLVLGVICLSSGLIFYLGFRQSVLSILPDIFGLHQLWFALKQTSTYISIPFAQNLPSFLHILGMTYLSAGLLGMKGKPVFYIVSFWLLINILFEAGQLFHHTMPIQHSNAVIQLMIDFFQYGIFDVYDLLALLFGFILINLMEFKFKKYSTDFTFSNLNIVQKLLATSLFIIGIGSIMGTSTCNSDNRSCEPDYSYKKYDPVYMSYEELRAAVNSTQERTLEDPGKIYLYQNFILVNSINKGIFIYDNKNPSEPLLLSFINIPGNLDLAVKNGFLYADSYIDLVVIDIADPKNIQEVNRITDIFPYSIYQNIPENVYLYSVDRSKGVIVGYKEIENE